MKLHVKTHDRTTYHYIQTNQFKSRILNLRFMADLHTVNPTARTLMLALLRASNQDYPTRRQFRQQLESMYDSVFSASPSRYGTKHVAQMTMIMIDDRFTLEGTLFSEGLAFLQAALTRPLFDADTLAEEKQFLKDYFNAEYANKNRYAFKRFRQHLMANHPYQGHAYGAIESIDAVTLEDIEAAYRAMLANDQIYVSYLGSQPPEHVHPQLLAALNLHSGHSNIPILYRHAFEAMHPRKESHPVSQQRWFTALKSDVIFRDADYYAMLVSNTLLGEGGDSLLFKTIREEHALAYHIGSSYSAFTGLVTISSGMDAQNVPQTRQLVESCLTALREGHFTDEDLTLAKTHLISQYKKSYDSASAVVAKALNASLFDIPFRETNLIETLASIDREAVMAIGKRLKPIFDFEFGGVSGDDATL